MARQEEQEREQASARTDSIVWNILVSAGVLAYYCFLFVFAFTERMSLQVFFGNLLLCIFGGFLLILMSIDIVRSIRGPLEARLYATRLHLIHTDYDTVRWWPLFLIRDVRVVHHHTNGSYEKTALSFSFDGSTESFSLRPKEDAELVVNHLGKYQKRMHQAAQAQDWTYFDRNDDFSCVSTEARSSAHTKYNRTRTLRLFGAGLIVSVLIPITAYAISRFSPSYTGIPPQAHEAGADRSDEVGVEHTAAKIEHPPLSQTPPVNYQPSNDGVTYKWVKDLLDKSKQLTTGQQNSSTQDSKNETSANKRKWWESDAVAPSATESVQAKPPATGTITETEFWAMGSETPLPLPVTGTHKRKHTTEAVAPLQIKTRGDKHYFVKLVDSVSDKEILTVFVRGGQTAELDVPLGSMKMRYAMGTTWYGDKKLFLHETTYAEAESILHFRIEGERISGYTVELFLQPNGNLKERRIRPDQW
jgi:hypothetical protein